MAQLSASWGPWGVCCVLLGVAGCQAEPPGGNGSYLPPAASDPRFGDVATCSPPSPTGVVGCGQAGHVCASDVLAQAEPDGAYVDLASCTLDLSYTRGTIVTRRDRIDLVVHLGAQVSGLARVEASADGEHYQVVGFINDTPAQTDSRCLGRCASATCQAGQLCSDGQACWQEPTLAGEAPASTGYCLSAQCRPGGLVLLDLAAADRAGGCNTVYNITQLRLSQYAPASGSVTVDAVEVTPGSFAQQGRR